MIKERKFNKILKTSCSGVGIQESALSFGINIYDVGWTFERGKNHPSFVKFDATTLIKN